MFKFDQVKGCFFRTIAMVCLVVNPVHAADEVTWTYIIGDVATQIHSVQPAVEECGDLGPCDDWSDEFVPGSTKCHVKLTRAGGIECGNECCIGTVCKKDGTSCCPALSPIHTVCEEESVDEQGCSVWVPKELGACERCDESNNRIETIDGTPCGKNCCSGDCNVATNECCPDGTTYNEQSKQCEKNCPDFDDSLTETGCRTKMTDENGCPYWKEEENCLPCTETVEPESKDIFDCATVAGNGCGGTTVNCGMNCYAGGIHGAFCSYSVTLWSEGVGGNRYLKGEVLWSHYPTLYQNVEAYNASKYKNDICDINVRGKMRSSNCPSGQVCIKGRCAESSQCADNEMALNGLCIPYYDGCPANSRAASNGCYCKKGYQPTAWQSVTTRNETSGVGSETAITTCSPCPANSTATSDGVCACNVGYRPVEGEYTYKLSIGTHTRSYLKSCEACPNSVPQNATRSGSCKNITCNTGYQPTRWSYWRDGTFGSYSYNTYISYCSPCPANSTGRGGSCSCNTGYVESYGQYPLKYGNTTTTKRYLQSCQKK